METETITLLRIDKEDGEVCTFHCTRPRFMTWEVGSNGHISLREPTGNKEADKQWQRHMSVISHPKEDYFSFTTRIRENGSFFKQTLGKLKKGDSLILYGLNNRIPLRREGRSVVFLSMGSAVTACRPFFLDYAYNKSGIPEMISLNIDRSGMRLLEEEIANLSIGNLKLHYYTGREEFYRSVDEIAVEKPGAIFYPIGSDGFLTSLCLYLFNRGISADFLSIDKKKGPVEFLKSIQSTN